MAAVSVTLCACATTGEKITTSGEVPIDPVVMRDIESPGGGNYTNLASKYFWNQISVTDKACEASTLAIMRKDRMAPRPFNFIVTVAADGAVSGIGSSSDTELTRCYQENFISRFPAPPFAPFHLQFWLFSKRGTADASQPTVEPSQPEYRVEDIGHWMSYYYLDPQPDRVTHFIDRAYTAGTLKDENVTGPIAGFLAGVLSVNPELAEPLIEQMAGYSSVERSGLVLGIWWSGLPNPQSLLAPLVRPKSSRQGLVAHKLRARLPHDLAEVSFENGPWVLDALWGKFMATGDDVPIIRIMSALPWSTGSDEAKGDVNELLIGKAARWALTSNAVQHERVMDICEAQLKSQPKKIAVILREVIEEAKSQQERANFVRVKGARVLTPDIVA